MKEPLPGGVNAAGEVFLLNAMGRLRPYGAERHIKRKEPGRLPGRTLGTLGLGYLAWSFGLTALVI